MRTLAMALVFGLAVGAAGPAPASDKARCGSVPKDKWLTETAIKDKVGGLGYEVRRIKVENGCYEVKAVDKNGAHLELYVRPDTGEIVKPASAQYKS